jgi:hypothetical protein
MNRTCLDGSGLELYNVGCLGAFGRVDNVERDVLTFGQGFESAVLNIAEMNEYIAAIFASNETKAFGIIEPLYCTIFHDELPPSCILKLTEKAKKKPQSQCLCGYPTSTSGTSEVNNAISAAGSQALLLSPFI